MPWLNSDGLYIRFAAEEGTSSVKGGEVNVNDLVRQTDIILDLTKITSTDTVQHYTLNIPKTARIDRIDYVVETAATSGGAATLDVGFAKEDRTTELDFNGIIAALPVASMTANKVLTLYPGTAPAGALVGTVLSDSGWFTARYNTAAFTAGVLRVRIYWYIP